MSPERLAENPFCVLQVPTTASRLEVERAGQKLLSLLAIGSESAQTYQSPLGPRPRSESLVRAAVAALRDPQIRLRHELWTEVSQEHDLMPLDLEWETAFRSIDWGVPCTGG